MSARTAAGVLCASALVAGGLVPTTAYAKSQDGAKNDGGEAHIKVCKYYEEDEDQWFYFKSWTEDHYDTYNFKLRDHKCKSYYIEYDQDESHYYYLKERYSHDYQTSYEVYGDYEDSWDNGHGKFKVEFNDDDNPYVKIRVYNSDS
jgi:hypothetical protein